jgi:deoxyribonuclease V
VHLAVDVDYRDDGSAVAAGVLFPDWHSGAAEQTLTHRIANVAAYTPGRFFERELPCILALLEDCQIPPRTIVIDGHVHLDGLGAEGLGAHLFNALGGRVPVIGVAKSRFRDTPAEAEVLRGSSAKPLYVTSIGIPPDTARRLVRDMHGAHRIPTLLAAVDRVCRTE